MKEKRQHLRATKDNAQSPSSTDTESSDPTEVDPNYGTVLETVKFILQGLLI